MPIEDAPGLVTLQAMDDRYEPRPEFSAPPDLLSEAKKSPDEFRAKTISVLRAAGHHGSAYSLQMMRWPAGIWGTLCTWAESQQDGYEHVAKVHAAARDHLGALAEAAGISFVWSDKDEDYVAMGLPSRVQPSASNSLMASVIGSG
jgi:hypothetical protein